MSCRRSLRTEEGYPLLGFRAGFAELSPLGDSIANLLYSLALSRALGRVVGRKVSNSILARAVVEAGLRGRAGRRVSRHELGDFAESLIAHVILGRRLSLEEGVELLTRELRGAGEENLEEASVAAFAALLARAGEVAWEEG
ncbi:MAG: hypothetical protein GXO66_05095 [Euryarchaeota archaeon]|nr:hypothetical protein [Euryarchaeota archaeon]